MDNSITNISLLDCNSKFSEEKIGGNQKPLALYTNKIGHGIRVNAGDKVSVQSAYVSELGAGGDSIEFTNDLLEQRTLQYVKIEGNTEISACNLKILGYESASAVLTDVPLDARGNSTTILYGFYKTNNGENCFTLPRRWVFAGSEETHTVDNWKTEDSIADGRPYHQSCLVDNGTRGISYNNGFTNNFIADCDYYWYQTPSVFSVNWTAHNWWKAINNNSRFQIFVRKDTWYGKQTNEADNPTANSLSDSPSNWEYLEYIDKLDIELPVGFSSTTAVSEAITNAFRKQSEPETVEYYSSSNNTILDHDQNFPQKYIPISNKIDSAMYKTFFSATPRTNNASTFTSWTGWINNTSLTIVNDSLNYLSSYQYIGVKRPELFKAGRTFAKYLMTERGKDLPAQGWVSLVSNLDIANFERDAPDSALAHTIILNLPWTTPNLQYIRDIVLEQAHHPELFNNRYNQFNGFTTVNNSRFLHINQRNNDVEYFSDILGGDNIVENASALNRCSCPIFFDYNPAYANLLTEGQSWEAGYAYGFAKKFISGFGGEYIALTTSHMNKANLPNASATTIPTCLFEINDGTGTGTTIAANTNFGWDTHFNSFGNVCIGLTTGWCYEMFHELEKTQALPTLNYNGQDPSTSANIVNPPIYTSDFVQEIYLGADKPVCSFNTTTNRYEIAQLHTPEFIQNPYNAGGINPTTTENVAYVDEVATAGDRVFKINKRLNNSNFTPDMKSYTFNEHTLAVRTDTGGATSVNFNVDFLNPNLTAWAIYDQLCGVLIKDFGYTQNTWNDGIWGILGFTYEQFNTTRTSVNDLSVRVGNNNKDALPYAFTNADIEGGDTINFPSNCFGSSMFSLQMPLSMSFNTVNGGSASGIFPPNYPVQTQPAITTPQTSVVLSAPNLPQKLLNGYFTIRSDIMEDSSFVGGFDSGQLYPVIAVVNKVDNTGNFFTLKESEIEFTFTKPKVITSIKTSIHNPSQALANVDRDSAVIYKITRQRPHQYDVIDEILNPPKTK
jgi:hypothetical protein